jgi:hypothetical protein
VLEALTGTGLATAAGLNAYIPLLTVGLLARYTDLITLPDSWRWLEHPVVLVIVGVLLVVEVVADKVPAVDHVNDVLQTVVRPTAGGLVFGASASSETVTVRDPDAFFSNHAWVPIVAGVLLSLVVHAGKAAARPIINATTLGVGAPVVSTIEDGVSVSMSVVAVVLPILVLLLLAGFVALVWWAVRRLTRRRRAQPATQPTVWPSG